MALWEARQMFHLATSFLLNLMKRIRRGGVIINEHILTADQTRRPVEVLGRWFEFISLVGRLTLFWLKYFDAWLIDKPATYDAASGFYFLGRKSDRILADRDLVTLYRGAQ